MQWYFWDTRSHESDAGGVTLFSFAVLLSYVLSSSTHTYELTAFMWHFIKRLKKNSCLFFLCNHFQIKLPNKNTLYHTFSDTRAPTAVSGPDAVWSNCFRLFQCKCFHTERREQCFRCWQLNAPQWQYARVCVSACVRAGIQQRLWSYN